MARPSVGSATTRHLVFAPLGSGGRTDAVVRRLGDAVALGLITDGEQLPSESELAGQLAVSTVTLREALATLREQGVVETRRGRGGGTFVRSPIDPSLQRLRARLGGMTTDELRDLGDLHQAVSGAAARLAAERAAPDQISRLTGLAAALATAADHGARRRADARFHIEMAAAAQSPRLTRQEIDLQSEVGELLWLPHAEAMDPAEAGRQHSAIAEAVADGDDEGARQLAEQHVRAGIERLIELHLRLQTRR